MTGSTGNPEDTQGTETPSPEGEGAQDGEQSAGYAVPDWAQPTDARRRRASRRAGWRDWRTMPRGRLLWPVAVILVLFAVWSNYPFVPNPWVALFRQPSGNVSAASGPQQWAMYGADSQLSGFIPQGEAPSGVVAYTLDVDGGVRSAPAVADGLAFIGGQSRIAAYDADTGAMVWERAVNGPAHGTPAVAGELAYLGMLGQQVLALDPASGDIHWEYHGGSPFPGAVTVNEGILYAASRGGHVHALDASTGDLLWKMDAGDPVIAPVAIADGKMFAATTAGLLYIRNARTGDKRARIRTGGAMVSPPVVDGERVYLLSGGDLMAFDTGTREMPGRYPAELVWAQLWVWGFPLPPPPEHAGLLWRVSPPQDMGDFTHPPAVASEAMYLVTDEGEIVALRHEDGAVLWRMAHASPIAASPVIVGDTLLVAHEDGALRAVNRFSREEEWALSLGSPPVAPLSYAAGTVYVHTQDGRLHAVR